MTERRPSFAARAFRTLLRLLPRDFRADYGAEMEEVFERQRRAAAAAGRRSLARLWLSTLAGALSTGPREHLAILGQDLRCALRALGQRPGFTLAAVATLALGLGANTALFSVLEAVVLRPLPYPDPERLMVVWERDADGRPSSTSYPTYSDLAARSHTVAAMTAFSDGMAGLAGDGEPELLEGLRVTHTFLATFGVAPALGRGFLPEEDRPDAERVVMLSDGLWRRRFGADAGVVGRQIDLSGRRVTVVGVLPRDFDATFAAALRGLDAQFLTPLRYAGTDPPACRTCRHLLAVARIAAGATREQAAAELDGIGRALAREHPEDYPAAGILLRPLREQMASGSRPVLLVLLGAVGFVLLIATANLAGLLIARAAERRKEMAVRGALGAGAGRLLRQLATEGLVLSLLGGGAGMALAAWGLRALVALGPADIPRLQQAGFDGPVVAFTLGLAVLAALCGSLAPAVQLRRASLASPLAEGGRTAAGAPRQRLRTVLVVGEVALALVLVAGAGLLLRSFERLLAEDPGFDVRPLTTAEVSIASVAYDSDAKVVGFFQQAIERLAALPGVEAAGMVTPLPVEGHMEQYSVEVVERPLPNPALAPSVVLFRADAGYFRALELPLVSGRFFTRDDGPGAPLVALLGEGTARALFPGEDPLGKQVRFGGADDPARTVVGVVGEVRHQGPGTQPPLQAYVPHAQFGDWTMNVVLRSARRRPVAAAEIQRAVWAVDAGVPVRSVRPMAGVVAASVAQRRFVLTLLGLFAAMAVALAAVGLYGVVAYLVEQRRREIGLRVALGARRRDILGMVLRDGLLRVLAGLAVGLAGALALGGALRSLLFEVPPTDPPTLLAATAGLLAVALAACYLPARRATRVDPTVALEEG
jgi:putative ABC transport system permease protein